MTPSELVDPIHFSTDYGRVWQEDQNVGERAMLRDKLRSGMPVKLTLQPGDATRYEFLLVPAPIEVVVSDTGREPEHWSPPGGHVLYVTVLKQLGKGVGEVRSGWTLEQVRQELAWHEDMSIRNACTLEALVHATHAVWCDE